LSNTEGTPKRRWRLLLLEIAAIFIGITASFWVDEWREERQDTATFHRILGEIYYDIIRDESFMTGWAATNNQRLQYAANLTLRDTESPLLDDMTQEETEVLFQVLDGVFFANESSLTLGGYSRLTNTALNIPVNDIQLALDNLYGMLIDANETSAGQLAELRELRTLHWYGSGVIPCRDFLEGWQFLGKELEELDLLNQVSPAHQAIRRDDECLSKPFNHEVAIQAVEDETFRTALRQAIRIRLDIASELAWQRTVAGWIRWRLEDYLPDISLPIETLGIIGSATGAEWNQSEAIAMQRLGPNDWVLDISLTEGEVKFLANHEWTMNWGAPRPWVATGSGPGFEAGLVSLEDVFPSGTAWFNGPNIPVRAGHYRVRFNPQSGRYSFEPLDD
jgi:hypothetical protein